MNDLRAAVAEFATLPRRRVEISWSAYEARAKFEEVVKTKLALSAYPFQLDTNLNKLHADHLSSRVAIYHEFDDLTKAAKTFERVQNNNWWVANQSRLNLQAKLLPAYSDIRAKREQLRSERVNA